MAKRGRRSQAAEAPEGAQPEEAPDAPEAQEQAQDTPETEETESAAEAPGDGAPQEEAEPEPGPEPDPKAIEEAHKRALVKEAMEANDLTPEDMLPNLPTAGGGGVKFIGGGPNGGIGVRLYTGKGTFIYRERVKVDGTPEKFS